MSEFINSETVLALLRIFGAVITFLVGIEVLLIAYEIGNSRLIKFVKFIGVFFIVFAAVRGLSSFIAPFYVIVAANIVFSVLYYFLHKQRKKLKDVTPKIKEQRVEAIDEVIDYLLGLKSQ